MPADGRCDLIRRLKGKYIYMFAHLFVITQFMQHSPPWEANRFSASKEIPCIFWNLKVHYHIHKCSLPVRILNQLDPVHTPTSYFLKIHLNIIPHLSLGLPSGLFPSGFATKSLYPPLLSPYALHAPPISSLFYRPTILGEQYRSLRSSICSFLQSPVTSSLLISNILLSTLFSNTLSLLSTLNVGEQVSHPYKKHVHLMVWIVNSYIYHPDKSSTCYSCLSYGLRESDAH
jgi:hypothetical protein